MAASRGEREASDPGGGDLGLPEGLLGLDFFAIAESAPFFVAVALLDNRVAYVNPAGRALVGLDSLEEARSRAVSDYLTPPRRG